MHNLKPRLLERLRDLRCLSGICPLKRDDEELLERAVVVERHKTDAVLQKSVERARSLSHAPEQVLVPVVVVLRIGQQIVWQLVREERGRDRGLPNGHEARVGAYLKELVYRPDGRARECLTQVSDLVLAAVGSQQPQAKVLVVEALPNVPQQIARSQESIGDAGAGPEYKGDRSLDHSPLPRMG